jgi:hypothetical protein
MPPDSLIPLKTQRLALLNGEAKKQHIEQKLVIGGRLSGTLVHFSSHHGDLAGCSPFALARGDSVRNTSRG